jgi:short-subunit dehydrogenase
MNIPFKPLDQQVIVITGASSGIGLATARAAAEAKAKLVLVSRNARALSQIVDKINDQGGQAIHVVADVARREELQRAADLAIERFGGFDTWINDAGVSIYGRLEDVSDLDHQRLFQTNFWGVVYGSLVALPHLKLNGGALINVGSEASDTAVPFQGMYSATKHAVKGFTDALRMELMEQNAPVSVTLIKPAGIDTPYPQHARNYFPQEPKLPPPVYSPEEVARAILFAATHAKRDIYVGGGARARSVFGRVVPQLTDRHGAKIMAHQQMRDEPARDPAGSLHFPGIDGRVHGEYPGRVMRTSLYTRASMHPLLAGALVIGVGAATYAARKRFAPKMWQAKPKPVNAR